MFEYINLDTLYKVRSRHNRLYYKFELVILGEVQPRTQEDVVLGPSGGLKGTNDNIFLLGPCRTYRGRGLDFRR